MWSIDWRLYCFYEVFKRMLGLSAAIGLGKETEVLDKLNAAAATSFQRMNGYWSLGHSERGQRECESEKDLIKRKVGEIVSYKKGKVKKGKGKVSERRRRRRRRRIRRIRVKYSTYLTLFLLSAVSARPPFLPFYYLLLPFLA